MNIWQKITIVIGTLAIALILLVYPITKECTVEVTRGFGSVIGATEVQTVIDYSKTLLTVGGVIALTAALTVALGFIKKA